MVLGQPVLMFDNTLFKTGSNNVSLLDVSKSIGMLLFSIKLMYSIFSSSWSSELLVKLMGNLDNPLAAAFFSPFICSSL